MSALKRLWWRYGLHALVLVVPTAMIVGGGAIVFLLESASCSAKWGDRSAYGLYSGCMVDGVPEKNIRIIVRPEDM